MNAFQVTFCSTFDAEVTNLPASRQRFRKQYVGLKVIACRMAAACICSAIGRASDSSCTTTGMPWHLASSSTA